MSVEAIFTTTTFVGGRCTGRKIATYVSREKAEADLPRLASNGHTRPGETLGIVEGRPVAEAGAKAARPVMSEEQQRASVFGNDRTMNQDM